MGKLKIVPGKPQRRDREQIEADRAALIEYVGSNAEDDGWVSTNSDMNLDDITALIKSGELLREVREVKDGNLVRRRSHLRLAGAVRVAATVTVAPAATPAAPAPVAPAGRTYAVIDTMKDHTYQVTTRPADKLDSKSVAFASAPTRAEARKIADDNGFVRVANFTVAKQRESN